MIERKDIDGKSHIFGYHVQECRGTTLIYPQRCTAFTAWLGEGYYFWIEEEFAHMWGKEFKVENTGTYEIYTAWIQEDGLLNTTFSECYYFLFQREIDKAINYLKNVLHQKITINAVHRFLARHVWPEMKVTGIIYDDLPHNPKDGSRTYSEIHPLYYKKRIQIVVFDRTFIKKFKLESYNLC